VKSTRINNVIFSIGREVIKASRKAHACHHLLLTINDN
jgi:hypothetical protein